MKRVTGWITVVILLLIMATACQSDENLTLETDTIRIGVVLKALDSEHWLTLKQGAEKAAKDYNVEVILLAPDKETNVQMQYQIIDDLITQKVDALCIAPCDSTGVIPYIKKAQQKGIPVIAIDTNADTKVVSFVGTDNYLAGKMAGERMIEILKGQGNVVLMTGVIEQQTHRDRSLGFKDALLGSDIKIVRELEANSESELAMRMMQDLLSQQIEVDAVFSTSGLMALGVLEALDDSSDINRIKVIGFDIQQELLEGVKNGKVDSVIAQNPYQMGYEAVETAVDYLNQWPIEEYIDTGTELITKENIDRIQSSYNK